MAAEDRVCKPEGDSIERRRNSEDAEPGKFEDGGGEAQGNQPATSKCLNRSGSSNSHRGNWWKSVKGFKLRYYVSPYVLDDRGKCELAKCIGIREAKVFVKEHAIVHGHPVSACLRDIAETCVMRLCGNKRLLDVGGSILRHANRKQKKVHCCHSNSEHWKPKLDGWLSKLKDGQKVTKECKAREWVTYCTNGVASCSYKPDVVVSSDSLYYMTEAEYLSSAVDLAYAIVHHYPASGKYLNEEQEVTVDRDLVQVKISGAAETYNHKQVNVTNHQVAVGSKLWKVERVAKFKHYYVMKYVLQDAVVLKTSKVRRASPKNISTKRASEPSTILTKDVSDDKRVPGQKTGAPPQSIKDSDNQEWTLIGDWPTKVHVLQPILSILASYVTPFNIGDPNLIKTLYTKYDQIARQYNIDPLIYAGMKNASVRIGYYQGVVNDLAMPRRFYNGWWSKAFHKVCSRLSSWVSGQALFDPEVDIATIMEQNANRVLDDGAFRRVMMNVYGVDPFHLGVLQETVATPYAWTRSTMLIVGICIMIGLLAVILLYPFTPTQHIRKGGNASPNWLFNNWTRGEWDEAIRHKNASTMR